MTDMPTMRTAFRTTVSGGGKYEMVFRFPTMDAMHAADDEWRAHLPIPEAPASVEPEPPEIEQVYIAQGINADGGPPWNWYVVGPEGEVAYCQTEDGENHAHMIAVALNDRVHILREDLKKYQAEPDTIGSHFGNGGRFDPVETDETFRFAQGIVALANSLQGRPAFDSEIVSVKLIRAVAMVVNGEAFRRMGLPPSPGFGGGDLREAVAVALWKREAERAAPNVAKGRNAVTFHDQLECEKEKWLGLADAALAAHPPVKQSVGFYYPIEMPLDADGNGPATIGKDAVRMTYQVWDQYCDSHGDFDFLADAIQHANKLNAALSHDQRGGVGE